MKDEKIYKRAVEVWGVDSQINMLKEELAELIVALCKCGRKINGSDIYRLAEEVADVELMIEQLHYILKDRDEGKWYSAVKKWKEYKLERLQEHLDYDEKHTHNASYGPKR